MVSYWFCLFIIIRYFVGWIECSGIHKILAYKIIITLIDTSDTIIFNFSLTPCIFISLVFIYGFLKNTNNIESTLDERLCELMLVCIDNMSVQEILPGLTATNYTSTCMTILIMCVLREPTKRKGFPRGLMSSPEPEPSHIFT